MTNRQTRPGPLEQELAECARLLATEPARAAQRAVAVLKIRPGQPQATLILGVARRLLGDLRGALQVLSTLARTQPGWAPAAYETGVTLSLAGRRDEALGWLRRAVQLQADIGDAWRLIAGHLRAQGDATGAEAALAIHQAFATRDPDLAAAATALVGNRVTEAEALLRARLTRNPNDVLALRMQADVAVRLRRSAVAAQLLAHCLELAPDFTAARFDYARVLGRLNRPGEALEQLERLLEVEPGHPGYREQKAALLTRLGDYAQADAIYATIVADYPDNADYWTRRGHSLRMTGNRDEATAAYRRAIDLAPGLGEAYWSLANVKNVEFRPEEVTALRHQLARADLADEDRVHLRFALGKALEDAASYAESFRQYAEGNRLRRATHPYDPAVTSALVERSVTTFTRAFFDERQGWGAPEAGPIFIVGLPRSGSTLVEQILASHSAVEATTELLDLPALAWDLRARHRTAEAGEYPELLAQVAADEFRSLGERYLEQTRPYRRTGAPFFIDKLPNNWEHAGLIQLALPGAKIVDVRRDPMACGFSCFKQHFAAGQDFAYDLRDIGRYYRDYVRLMAHLDEVRPGRVHRVRYERLVADTESEVRRLLEYCGLEFEAGCLRFYENRRPVPTPSSEQVRSPIFHDALEHWRHYESWLGPLAAELGPLAS